MFLEVAYGSLAKFSAV